MWNPSKRRLTVLTAGVFVEGAVDGLLEGTSRNVTHGDRMVEGCLPKVVMGTQDSIVEGTCGRESWGLLSKDHCRRPYGGGTPLAGDRGRVPSRHKVPWGGRSFGPADLESEPLHSEEV